MNREQRRKLEKEERRNPNSKRNFKIGSVQEVPLDQIQHDPNLKECDMEVVELISHRLDWAEQGLVSNDMSKCIIIKGCAYLDALCSLRFDITPPDDRAMIRNTMYYVGNYTNMFIGMLLDDENDKYNGKTITEYIDDSAKDGSKNVEMSLVHDMYPFCNLPNKEIVDDLYASFIAEHAQELSSFLQHTRKFQIEGDEEYVLEVLHMILKKTDELINEAQVDSQKFVVKL